MSKIEVPPSHLGVPEARFALDHLECNLIRTADGSPSLRYRSCTSAHWTEPMHSSKGAWSETLHVYEPALARAFEHLPPGHTISIASIGLGLGYNELLSVAMSLRLGRRPEDIFIVSFESQPELRSAFEMKFRHNNTTLLPPALNAAYDNILNQISAQFSLPSSTLQHYLDDVFCCQNFQMTGALETVSLENLSLPPERCHCVLFDAFSPDSSPDLWDEELLQQIVARLCASDCVFASYASRTGLKRILKNQGFILEKVSGFAGKRERTLAVRKLVPEA